MVAGFDTQVKRSWIMASIITVTAVLLAIVARYTLKPWLVAGEPYFLFCVAVLIAAIAGGGRQALLAAILSVGAAVVLELVEPRSEEHTSELQSLMRISYAVFCLKKKTHTKPHNTIAIRNSDPDSIKLSQLTKQPCQPH